MGKLERNYDLSTLRHSAAHILAKALKNIYGHDKVKLGIGPAIEDGFYYDVELPERISQEDLKKIEKEMRKIVEKDEPFYKKEVSKKEAREIFKNDPYKLELIDEIEGDTVSLYYLGDDFVDLCKGPHVPSSKHVRHFKLLNVAGAYWRGDSRRPQLQRIYGTAFFTEKELKDYLRKLEEAKKRDHRKLGRELKLFEIFEEEAGPGLVFYLPKGAIIRSEMEKYLEKEHEKRGYQKVYIPHIMRVDLWKTSGHYDFYRENMFFVPIVEHEEGEVLGNKDVPLTKEEIDKAAWYAVKPMNCPGHILIYKNEVRSYKDLPIKFYEFGTVYRYEKSGSLHGLLRVRGFTQDDAHIICTPEQVEEEVKKVVKMAFDVLKTFGFEDFEVYISTRPEKYVGTDEMWNLAENSLKKALEDLGVEYKIDEGGGAFYGPKIDIKVKDCLGRKWQCSTVQFDFNLPERFDMTYVDKDGEKKRPYMIHRAILGSFERFFGLLIEHYAGLFPLWLAPIQVRVIPISEKFVDYAKEITKKLKEAGIRVDLDDRDLKVGKKIREAELEKIPYMVIVGQKEQEEKTISVRSKKKGQLGNLKLEEFIEMLKKEIENKEK